MRFNVKKCCILCVSTMHSTSNFIYTMYSIPLQVVEQHHYLGVLIDNKLSWTPHMVFLIRTLQYNAVSFLSYGWMFADMGPT